MEMQDSMGKEILVQFSTGGFENDITICKIYKENILGKINLIGKKSRIELSEVYSQVTCDSLSKVAKWSDAEWKSFAQKTVNNYNNEVVSRDIVAKKMAKFN